MVMQGSRAVHAGFTQPDLATPVDVYRPADALSFRTCDVRIDALELDEAVDQLLEFALDRVGRAVHLCAAYNLALASRRPELAAIIDRGDLNLPDGAPLVYLAQRLGTRSLTQKVRPRGTDVLATTVKRGRRHGIRHYLYGSDPETVHALAAQLEEAYPGAEIVGVEPSVFRPLSEHEERALAARIRDSKAHIVWVGLGTPLQDEFVDRFHNMGDATFVAVGAAFDFLSGAKRQAPRWIQRLGFEWAFRLLAEPGRLWKRYLFGNLVFAAGVARGVTIVEPRSR